MSSEGAPEVAAGGHEHDLGDQAAGQHRVDDAVAQGGGHHRERLLDLGAAEHEHARPRRLLAEVAQGRVLPLEQPAHGRRQQLLEAHQCGLRAVDGRERVAHVQVGERRQLAHEERLGLVFGREVELGLEERQLFADEAHVVEQQHLAVGEGLDGARARPGRRRRRRTAPAAR